MGYMWHALSQFVTEGIKLSLTLLGVDPVPGVL
jgi:hypothetical protein